MNQDGLDQGGPVGWETILLKAGGPTRPGGKDELGSRSTGDKPVSKDLTRSTLRSAHSCSCGGCVCVVSCILDPLDPMVCSGDQGVFWLWLREGAERG